MRNEIKETVNNLLEEAKRNGGNNVSEMLRLADEALNLARLHDLDLEKATAHNLIGNSYWFKGQYGKAKEHYEIVKSFAIALDDKEKYHAAINNLSLIAYYQGDFENSLNGYFESLEWFTLYNNAADFQLKIAILNGNIGLVYNKIGLHKKAIKYFKKAEVVYDRLDSKALGLMDVYNQIGKAYKDLEQFDEALVYFKKSHEASKQTEDNYKIAYSHYNIGDVMSLMGRHDEALEYLEKAVLLQEGDGISGQLCITRMVLGRAYLRLDDSSKAISELEKSAQIMQDIDSKQCLDEVYLLLGKAHTSLGNHSEANEYFQQHIQLRGDIFTDSKSKMLLEIEAKYESKSKENKIKKLVKEKTELTSQNSELEIFAGRAAHDIKEPLRTITLYSSLLRKNYQDKIDETGQSMLGFMEQSSMNLSKLLMDILEYAKIGTAEIDLRQVNINDILKVVKNNLAQQIEEENASIILKGSLPSVKATHSLLVVLFQNIVSNSLRYAKDNIDVIVTIESESDNQFQKVSITDNGVGIKQNQLDRIFVLFHQAAASSTNEKGSGIGLSTCMKIMQILKGDIKVSSVYGESTTFELYFPV